MVWARVTKVDGCVAANTPIRSLLCWSISAARSSFSWVSDSVLAAKSLKPYIGIASGW